MSTGERACTYASLILHDDGIVISPEKITALVRFANVKIDSYWPSLFSKLFEKRSIHDLILNVGSGGAPVVVAAPATAAGVDVAPAAAAEEKKEEPKEESHDDIGFNLFD